MVLALLQNLVRKTQNLARLLEDFTSTFHNIAVPYSIALPQNLVRKTQNLARFLEDLTSTFHNSAVPYSKADRGFCIKKTLCLFWNDSAPLEKNETFLHIFKPPFHTFFSGYAKCGLVKRDDKNLADL